uniref:hypothetical protein n=1 Tax=Clostridium sp. NkU-1 TaxID=1095009 RepID=UPI000A71D845
MKPPKERKKWEQEHELGKKASLYGIEGFIWNQFRITESAGHFKRGAWQTLFKGLSSHPL